MDYKFLARDLLKKFNLNRDIAAVYCIIFNGKRYIGSAITLKRRMSEHIQDFKSNSHANKYMQNVWNKYGYEVFSFEIIEEWGKDNKPSEKDLKAREKFWIQEFNTGDKTVGANLILDPVIGGLFGFKHTEESKKKMSESIKNSEYYKSGRLLEVSMKNITNAQNPESRLRASQNRPDYNGESNPFYGKTHSEETKKLFSKQRKGRHSGEKNPNFGKIHSFETRQIISNSQAKEYVLINPQGESIKIKNMKKYCRENGLSSPYMFQLASGIRDKYKGWTRPINPLPIS